MITQPRVKRADMEGLPYMNTTIFWDLFDPLNPSLSANSVPFCPQISGVLDLLPTSVRRSFMEAPMDGPH